MIFGAIVGLGQFALHGGNDELLSSLPRYADKFFKNAIVFGTIDVQPGFGSHLLGDVDEYTLFGVQVESSLAANDVGLVFPSFFRRTIEQFQAAIERAQETLFLLKDDAAHALRIALSIREARAHLIDNDVDDLVQEGSLGAELLPAIAFRPAQDAANDITSSDTIGQTAIGKRKSQRADVIADHPISRILQIVEFSCIGRSVTSRIASKMK